MYRYVFFAVSRPVSTGKTITEERINPFPTRMRRKLSSALMYGEANTVYSNIPNRATRDICIRRCGNAPLKIDRGGLFGIMKR